jgi:hypothetical protein
MMTANIGRKRSREGRQYQSLQAVRTFQEAQALVLGWTGGSIEPYIAGTCPEYNVDFPPVPAVLS